jgi:hypothetical protein
MTSATCVMTELNGQDTHGAAAQEERTFTLRVAEGSPGFLRWTDHWTGTVEVRPSDTLAQVGQALASRNQPSPEVWQSVRVAPTADTTLVWSHHALPHPYAHATVSQNGLHPECIMRWVQIRYD